MIKTMYTIGGRDWLSNKNKYNQLNIKTNKNPDIPNVVFIFIIFTMTIWILFSMIFYQLLQQAVNYDIFAKDFQLFSKDICKFGCSSIICYPNTLISIDIIEPIRFSDDYKCNQHNPNYSLSPFNCHFKYIQNHILKTCSNTVQCELCLNKIESEYLPNALCTSDHDFIIKYRCIPGFIKNDNVCADSYLDIDCYDRMEEKLVIFNATLYPEIKSTSEDPRGCVADNTSKKRARCHQIDKTNHAISTCSYRLKCSIGPHKFTPTNCGNMHMRLSYACVPKSTLNHYNKLSKDKASLAVSNKPWTSEMDSSLWINKNKWTILGVSLLGCFSITLIISLLICYIKKNYKQRTCDINTPKENLFSQLGKQKFTPPPSSIDKVNMEFENGSMVPPDLYTCNSDNEEINIRTIYAPNIPNPYNSQFCNSPPSINTCQYFAPLLSSNHVNMMEIPSVQVASSGNLTSSTINSSLGTPRGTKSSGIFSMTDMSFENAHLV